MMTLKIEVIDVAINNTAEENKRVEVWFKLTIDKESLPSSTGARFCGRHLNQRWGYGEGDDKRSVRVTSRTGELDNLDRFIDDQVKDMQRQFADAVEVVDQEQAVMSNLVGLTYYVTVKSARARG